MGASLLSTIEAYFFSVTWQLELAMLGVFPA